ncbi:MAG: hypothetical protein EXR72_08530 [Myxococcales bacterium]|nr:hypothetical protein [Myxococcales bacterium]
MKPQVHALAPRRVGSSAPVAAAAASRLRIGAGTIGELVSMLASNGRWWMVPMVAVLGLCALLLLAVTAIEYVAPFVYTVF